MPYLLKLQYSRYGWAVIAGLWKVAEPAKVTKCVHDGAPIKVGEPIAVSDQEDLEQLAVAAWHLEELTSYATTIAYIKYMLGGQKKRVLVTTRALGQVDDDKLRACAAGGLDGIVPYPYRPRGVDKSIGIININPESEPGYLYVKYEELSKVKSVQGKIYGVIVEFLEKPSPEVLLNVREYLFRHLGPVDLLVGVNHIVATRELIRKIRDIVSGVVLTSLGKIVTVEVDVMGRDVYFYRCSNCMLDILASAPMRKCPYCQDKMTDMLKPAEQRLFSYTARELKFINMDFMSKFSPDKLRIEVR